MNAGLRCRSCASPHMQCLGACAGFPADWTRRGYTEPGVLYRCADCGLGQRDPVPDTQALIEMYRETPADDMDYRFEENAAWSRASAVLRSRFDGRADVPQVVDVGCHTGAFLAGLPANWRKHGIESAREPLRIASEQHGVTIIADRLETIAEPWLGKFDAVTMFDVVEHLPDPKAGILQAARLLKPGGVLLISSGDFAAWTWRWLGGGHWYLQTPQHLSLISESFLRKLADSHSLCLIASESIPHRRAPRSQRLREALELLHWGFRQRGGIHRLPQRLLQSLPGLRSLRHRRSVPWTMSLNDHLLAQLERVATSPESPINAEP